MRRSGFTMVELLVVITIMSILFALAFGVYTASVGAAREASTHATVLYLQKAVFTRSENMARQKTRSEATAVKAQYDTGGNAAPNDTLPLELAEWLVKKNRFRAAFPQRLEDMFGMDQRPGTQDDSYLWAIWKQTCNDNGLPVTDANIRPQGHRTDLENCELLYLFLSEGGHFGDNAFRSDDIPAQHLRETAIDTDGDGSPDKEGNGIPELVDSWGQPIRFYNWPTRLIRPGGTGVPIDQSTFTVTAAQFLALVPPPSTPSPFPLIDTSVSPPVGYYDHPINNDPDDPLGAMSAAYDSGVLNSAFWLNRNGSPAICPPVDEVAYHTLDTYHAPLVISGGPDERIGLYEPTEATDPARRNADLLSLDDALDNVTSQP